MAETLARLMVPAPAAVLPVPISPKSTRNCQHVIWWGFHFDPEAFDGFIDIAPLRPSDRPAGLPVVHVQHVRLPLLVGPAESA